MSLRLNILLPLVSLAAVLLRYLYGYWMPRSLANIDAGSLSSNERHLDSVAKGLVPLLLGHQLDMIYENLDSLMKKQRLENHTAFPDGRSLYPLEASSAAAADSRHGKDIHIIERHINCFDTELGSLVLTVDIAERKRSEKTMRLLSSIVESSDEAIIGKTLGRELRMIELKERIEELGRRLPGES